MIAKDSADRSQYLSFVVAGSDYGVGILQVKEILQYDTVTSIPSVPSSVRGVINLRGAVVPVIDLAVKFGLPASEVTKRTCIVIVEAAVGSERTVIGLVADAVREVLELGPAEIEPPPSFGTQLRVDFLVGMAKSGRGFVLLLALDRVMSAGERAVAAHEARGDGPLPGVAALAVDTHGPASAAPEAAGTTFFRVV